MSNFLIPVAIYIAGVLTGHAVMTWAVAPLVKKELALVHSKLDAIISKDVVSAFKRSK